MLEDSQSLYKGICQLENGSFTTHLHNTIVPCFSRGQKGGSIFFNLRVKRKGILNFI
jgi:hypothetical protein